MTTRVVVDTNSWVSAFISRTSLVAQRLTRLLQNENVELLFSQTLRTEILTVIQRPKFQNYLPKGDLQGYLSLFDSYDLTPVTSQVTVCRDPKDNFLLALCQDGRADFLLTGDQDLLVLNTFGEIRIIAWDAADTAPGLLRPA